MAEAEEEIEKIVCDIIAKEARIDRAIVVPTATMEDLKVASLDLVEIIFAIEEKWDLHVPEEALKLDVKNVGEVVEVVRKLVVERAAGAPPKPAA